MVSTRTSVGSLGILANHAPADGHARADRAAPHKTDSDVVRFAKSEGYLQAVNNERLLLVEEAVDPDKLDRSDLEEKLRAAEQKAEQAEEDSEERLRHERDAGRYKAFIEVASS